MNVEKINDKIKELRKELMKSRAKSASKVSPENPGRAKEVRRTIARLLTKKGSEVKKR
jgi:large subunit ribosomal protein L29